MLNYYKPIRDVDKIYSCDMLRLSFQYKKKNGNIDTEMEGLVPLEKLRQVMALNDYSYVYYVSHKISAYFFMFVFEKGNQSIVIGLRNNASKGEYWNNFIEFNPNKVDIKAIRYVLHYFLPFIHPYSSMIDERKIKKRIYYKIVRWDLAVDLPVDRFLVKLFKDGRREYTYKMGTDGSLTEYSGKRNTNGFVKVYDKAKESSLLYDCTRIEVTCEGDKVSLPNIALKTYQYDFVETDMSDLRRTDRVLVEMFKRLDGEETDYWFKKLGRGKMKLLKPYIYSPEETFEFNYGCIFQVQEMIRKIVELEFEELGEEGGFIDTFIKWDNKYNKQHFAVTAQSTTVWKEIDESYARSLFS